MILISLITLFLKFRKDKINDEKLNDLLDTRGFVSRMFGPYFKFISHIWYVLPPGFLFVLGLILLVKSHCYLYLQVHHSKQFHS